MLSLGKAALPRASQRVRSGFREAALPEDAPSKPAPEVPVQTAPMQAPSAGREASIERRKALSQGKSAMPAAQERVRSGFREAELPEAPATPAPPALTEFEGGREASMARRKALSLGKAALPSAKERVRSGFREAAMPPDVSALSGREAAMKRRAERAQYGRGDAPASGPCRPPRQGNVTYPAKVPQVTTAVANATVTGLSYASGRAMTGAEAGFDKPLTGTQYVSAGEGGYRASMSKVGRTRTMGGQTVSGTMVRSTVKITGDEDSADIRITGNADQRMTDDIDARGESFVPVGAQFARQSQPHGHTVFGTNLGRSARSVGSRSRDTERPVEQTEAGHAVSGTAIGRSTRVSGDEIGSLRRLTGSQYLAPANAMVAPETGRADPASGGKVTESQTWGGQTITGPEMEHDRRVTGSEPGTCQTLTGTPYYGATGAHGWCDPESAEAEGALRARRTPRTVTGNVPLNDPMVSGTQRGAERNITGSSYFVAEEAGTDPKADSVAQSITGFSVSSPQRAAHLRARADQPSETRPGSAITGTFAQGEGKITGNVAFDATQRRPQTGIAPARRSLTGEGATKGPAITGSAWSENSRVTGTEDYTATSRNPSERAGSAHGFAGAGKFKSKAVSHDRKSKVTGAVGSTLPSSACVTLSGGASG